MMRDLILEIAEEAGISTINRGMGSFLVSANNVERFVETCHRGEIVIDGIEGFHLTDDGLMPDMDLIADFSSLSDLPWSERCRCSVQSARQFFKEAHVQCETLFDFQLREIADTVEGVSSCY